MGYMVLCASTSDLFLADLNQGTTNSGKRSRYRRTTWKPATCDDHEKLLEWLSHTAALVHQRKRDACPSPKLDAPEDVLPNSDQRPKRIVDGSDAGARFGRRRGISRELALVAGKARGNIQDGHYGMQSCCRLCCRRCHADPQVDHEHKALLGAWSWEELRSISMEDSRGSSPAKYASTTSAKSTGFGRERADHQDSRSSGDVAIDHKVLCVKTSDGVIFDWPLPGNNVQLDDSKHVRRVKPSNRGESVGYKNISIVL